MIGKEGRVFDTIWLAARYLTELAAVALGIWLLIGGKRKIRNHTSAAIFVSVCSTLFVISYFTYLVLGTM